MQCNFHYPHVFTQCLCVSSVGAFALWWEHSVPATAAYGLQSLKDLLSAPLQKVLLSPGQENKTRKKENYKDLKEEKKVIHGQYDCPHRKFKESTTHQN